MTTHEAISNRAREIWEREGRPEGKDIEHWLQAEAELRGGAANHQMAGSMAAPASGAPNVVGGPAGSSNNLLNQENGRKRGARRGR